MKALIGRKVGMSQIFGDKGVMTPVTLVQAGPLIVTQMKSMDKDGYRALQLGFGEAKKIAKPLAGHVKKSNPPAGGPQILREFRLELPEAESKDRLQVGDKLEVSQFAPGDQVKVTAVSKGKGFAGTIKRHGFKRGPKTHGSGSYRAPGSIGSMYPQKIWKGKKMAGRMGAEQVSKRTEICEVDTEQQVLAIKGPVPGPRRGLVLIKG